MISGIRQRSFSLSIPRKICSICETQNTKCHLINIYPLCSSCFYDMNSNIFLQNIPNEKVVEFMNLITMKYKIMNKIIKVQPCIVCKTIKPLYPIKKLLGSPDLTKVLDHYYCSEHLKDKYINKVNEIITPTKYISCGIEIENNKYCGDELISGLNVNYKDGYICTFKDVNKVSPRQILICNTCNQNHKIYCKRKIEKTFANIC